MEELQQRKLPNVTTSLVLGIISFLACCCTSGIGGVLFSGIALYLANKDLKTYNENPEQYSNYNQLKTARIVAIVGLALAVLSILIVVFQIISYGGWDAYMEEQMRMMEELGIEIE
ncbi:CCC motif membrane protein [Robertkochia aurantiaca]|uniref:CCC motif membrane protein n=1 Tax=Robertkochia aurantiaca TaxID=2873700 RepID=UPI001CCB4F66|nr:CCC motif membrane protein [Robertkochia sp. 3YJGBD-33]